MYVRISVYTKGWCMLDSKGKKKREKGDKEKLATSGLKFLECLTGCCPYAR
jgi:hypothetical protein